jgi:HK97 family phage prohead protease
MRGMASRHAGTRHDVTRSTAAAVLDTQIQAASELTGRAVPYNTPTNIGPFVETIAPGAFRESLAKTPRLPLLTYHDTDSDPIGVSVSWEERADGLHGTWKIDTSERAQEAARLVREGLLAFLSIRFQPEHDEWSTTADGRDLVTVRKARLLEVSLVSTPAYVDASVTAVRSVGHATTLAVELDAPLLAAAITGTPAQTCTAASLVRLAVEEHGARAVETLLELGGSVRDPALAVNLTRSAAALADADPAKLRALELGQWQAYVRRLSPGAASTRPRRRRRR